MQLRRWWSRRYSLPPNSPLFEAESVGYWQAQLMLDYHAEATALAAQLSESPPAGAGRQHLAWRAQAQDRLSLLGSIIDPTAEAARRQAKDDEAAFARGELPGWLRDKMAEGQEGRRDG